MPEPTVAVTFTITAIVKPDFLTYINTDRSARIDIERAMKKYNILRESEVVSGISVEQKGEKDEN